MSLVLAERVGPGGVVYAIDRSAEALVQLERRQQDRGLTQVRCVVADAATWDGADLRADSALVTMVLHHVDDPTGILHNVHRLLPAGAPAVVAEFHPDGPCEHGPPRAVRLPPEKVRAWCAAAGFRVREYRRQTPEHYMIVAARAA